MGFTLHELAEAKMAETEQEEEFGGEELAIEQDIHDALILLKKAKTMFSYLSDVDLCKSVKKPERESMANLADMIEEFIDEASTHYDDEE